MFEMQIFLLCLIIIGFLCVKFRLIDDNSRSTLSELILNIFLPCTILTSFFGTSRSELPSMGLIFIISLGTLVLGFGMANLLFRKKGTQQRKVLFYAMMIPNASFLGIPLVESIYGAGGLAYTAAYLIPLRTAIWSLGLAIFTGKGDLKKIFIHPCMIATFLGLLGMLLDFKPPFLVERLTVSLGNCTTPLSMMVVGCVLASINAKQLFNPLALYFSFIRLIAMPLIVLCILYFLRAINPNMSLITGISVIMTGTPAGVTTAILADKYGADSELASKIVFMSTLFSMLTIPALVFLLSSL